MKMNRDASLPGWLWGLGALSLLLTFNEQIATAWEWVRSGVDSEEQALMEALYPDLAETLKKAEEGDAFALIKMGDAYSQGYAGFPKSYAIAVKYYRKALEKAAEEDDEYTRLAAGRDAAWRISMAYLAGRGAPESYADYEKWGSEAEKFRQGLRDPEEAKRQQLIEEHEAMIPQ